MNGGNGSALKVEMPVGQLAAEYPLATRVFARHRMDFCCGGDRTLGAVCAEKGLDPESILREIREELGRPEDGGKRWDRAPLEELIQHIITAYHWPLEEELPRLEAMARKVYQVHRDKDPERLHSMLSVYLGLKRELEQHMEKEEQILFPMIQNGQGAMTGGPVSVMEEEHAAVGVALGQLRALTREYVAPDGACNTWRALWAGFEALERSLHQHIHLENNILFPRALTEGSAAKG